MKKFLVLSFVVISMFGFAATMADYFKSGLASSTDYELEQLNIEITEMNYEKSKIEASNQKQLISADISYYNALSGTRTSMKSIYGDLVDGVIDIHSSELNYEAARLEYNNSKIDYDSKKDLAAKGLISQDDLEEASLSLQESEINLDEAKLSLDNAVSDFEDVTDMAYDGVEFKVIDPSTIALSDEDFIAKDYSIIAKQKSLESAQYDLDNLSGYASAYDRKSYELGLKEATINLKSAGEQLLENHKNTLESLGSSYKNLSILKAKADLKSRTLEDTESRYNKGLISETEYNTTKIQYLNAEKSYMESLRSYSKSVINYLIDTDRLPEAVMN